MQASTALPTTALLCLVALVWVLGTVTLAMDISREPVAASTPVAGSPSGVRWPSVKFRGIASRTRQFATGPTPAEKLVLPGPKVAGDPWLSPNDTNGVESGRVVLQPVEHFERLPPLPSSTIQC